MPMAAYAIVYAMVERSVLSTRSPAAHWRWYPRLRWRQKASCSPLVDPGEQA